MEKEAKMAEKYKFDEKTGTLVPCEGDNKKSLFKNAEGVVVPKEAIKGTLTLNEQEGIVQFREVSDLTSFQIFDEQTRKLMGVISGYGLSIKFNMQELTSTDKVEQFLNGITSMFRKMILDQSLNGK